jgi:hypothetical protein
LIERTDRTSGWNRTFVAASTCALTPSPTTKHEKDTQMKKYLILAVLGLGACESQTEISAREQIDAACRAGNLQACAAVQQRVAAEGQNLALTLIGL